MLAITLWQPYASLWVSGEKRNETRPMATRVRGWVAVHAAVKTSREPDGLIRGAIVGLVNLADCIPAQIAATLASDKELRLGNYAAGRYAWKASDRFTLVHPVEAKGKQGWWYLSDSQIELLGRSLKLSDQMTTDLAIALTQQKRAKGGRRGDIDRMDRLHDQPTASTE